MQVFISWSGEESKAVGEVLRDNLRRIIQAVRPWMSPKDIDSGLRWTEEIGGELSAAHLGICVVTHENQNRPWLNFEAGAIAKSREHARLIPLLFDMAPSDLTGPLSQFQAREATKAGIFQICTSINNAMGDKGLKEPDLADAFDAHWPKVDAALNQIRENKRTAGEDTVAATREPKDLLEEILLIVRELRAPRPTLTPEEVVEIVKAMFTVRTKPSDIAKIAERLPNPKIPPSPRPAKTEAKSSYIPPDPAEDFGDSYIPADPGDDDIPF